MNLKILFLKDDNLKVFDFLKDYEHTMLEMQEFKNTIFYNISIYGDIEMKLDILHQELNKFRYMLIDYDESQEYFYRAHINKNGKKIVTNKATRYIGLL